jgi:hypothetical protein
VGAATGRAGRNRRTAPSGILALVLVAAALVATAAAPAGAVPANPFVVREAVNVLSDGDLPEYPSETVTSRTVSDDGRYVVFASYADGIVAGDSNGEISVFVRDRQTGTTELVSTNSAGNGPGNFTSNLYGVVSADGRYVAFISQATDLVAGTTTAPTTPSSATPSPTPPS